MSNIFQNNLEDLLEEFDPPGGEDMLVEFDPPGDPLNLTTAIK